MKLLEGKVGLITGLANERSIAWGIAQACHAQGATLVFTCQNERLERHARPLVDSLGATLIRCDATQDEEVNAVAAYCEEKFGRIDFLVHAIAFAERDDLKGRFIATSEEGFLTAMNVSVFTLIRLTRAFEGLLKVASDGGTILTLSYLGADRVIPNYNVMGVAKAALEAAVRYLAADVGGDGIRVNALSAGPIKTLSAAGLPGLRTMLSEAESVAPLRRNVTIEDVGSASLYLLSSLSKGTTGETIFVDGGYHTVGTSVRSNG